jgi:hypothetical protein
MSVLIDDNDPLVQYNSPSGWIVTGLVPEFELTTHASATPGDTATLAFEGASGQLGLQFCTDTVESETQERLLVFMGP